MIKGLAIALFFTVLVLLAVGIALDKQIQVNGEQRAVLAVQEETIKAAQKARDDATTAIRERDNAILANSKEISNYRSKVKELEDKYAEISNWSKQPIPDPVINLLCQLTSSNHPACVPS